MPSSVIIGGLWLLYYLLLLRYMGSHCLNGTSPSLLHARPVADLYPAQVYPARGGAALAFVVVSGVSHLVVGFYLAIWRVFYGVLVFLYSICKLEVLAAPVSDTTCRYTHCCLSTAACCSQLSSA